MAHLVAINLAIVEVADRWPLRKLARPAAGQPARMIIVASLRKETLQGPV